MTGNQKQSGNHQHPLSGPPAEASATAQPAAVARRVDRNPITAEISSQKVQQKLLNTLPGNPTEQDAKRFTQFFFNHLRQNPELMDCTPASVENAFLTCASAGMLVGDGFDGVYLIKYGNECKAQFGYLGKIELLRRTGLVKKAEAEVVYECDEFSYRRGINPDLTHIPAVQRVSNTITHVYAIVWLMTGAVQFEVMTADDVEKIRETYSKQPNGPAWKKSWAAMAKKTVINQLLKTLPKSVQDRTYQFMQPAATITGADAVPGDVTYEPHYE